MLGDSAVQLGARWASVEPKLATPACEFGIIAGGRGDDKGYSALAGVQGDNDGLLQRGHDALHGACDFVLVPVLHPLTMLNETVKQYTLSFLEKGYFISDEKRQPIVAEKEKSAPPPAKGESETPSRGDTERATKDRNGIPER